MSNTTECQRDEREIRTEEGKTHKQYKIAGRGRNKGEREREGKGRKGKEKQAIGEKMSKTEEKNEGGEKKVERNGKKANAN